MVQKRTTRKQIAIAKYRQRTTYPTPHSRMYKKEKQVNDGIKGAAMSAKQPTRSGRSKVRTGVTKLLYRRGAAAGTAETHGRSLETIRVSLARQQWGGNIVHAF
jgi:hypothetical protein